MLGLAMVALLPGLFGTQLALPAGSVMEQHSPAKEPSTDNDTVTVSMTAMAQGTPFTPSLVDTRTASRTAIAHACIIASCFRPSVQSIRE